MIVAVLSPIPDIICTLHVLSSLVLEIRYAGAPRFDGRGLVWGSGRCVHHFDIFWRGLIFDLFGFFIIGYLFSLLKLYLSLQLLLPFLFHNLLPLLFKKEAVPRGILDPSEFTKVGRQVLQVLRLVGTAGTTAE